MFPHHSLCGKTSRHLRFNRFFPALPTPKHPLLRSLEINQASLCRRGAGEKPDTSRESATAGDVATRGRRTTKAKSGSPRHGASLDTPTRAAGSPADLDPGGTPPPAPTCCSSPQGQILPLVQPSQPSHEAGSAPGKLTGRERQIRMHRSSRAINTHLYPSLNPSHSAMSAVRKIISSSLLQHKHLNSTSIYLWSPHDTSRSAREEEMYLRRKIKMCVCTSETRGLPRE